jgi:hypothetical protein
MTLPRYYTDEAGCAVSAMHFIAESWRLITPTTVKNCFAKHGSSTDLSSSNASAVKHSGDRDDDWHN